ncbi:MAG: peptidoglycan-binding domain-containing protein [Paracoccaceae bacterium]
MQTLRRGSRDASVTFLQRLLNQHFSRTPGFPGLVEDADFGPQTDSYLRQFQSTARSRAGTPLVVDGVAGGETWRALGVTDEVLWPLPRVGQTTGMSCWVVSQGLATGNMTSSTTAAQLGATHGLQPDLANLETFARESGMRLLGQTPAAMSEIAPHVRRGPVMLVGYWGNRSMHMVVISGYVAARALDVEMIRVHDPAPFAQGSIVFTDFPSIWLTSNGSLDPYAAIVR